MSPPPSVRLRLIVINWVITRALLSSQLLFLAAAAGACSGRMQAGDSAESDAAAGINPAIDASPASADSSSDGARDNRRTDTAAPGTGAIPSFPGAEGFGTDTPGGRGGKIYEVSNLNDKGPGSFREAAEATGKRIVVFRVSGTITLESDISISGPGSFLTIAGQSSPGGIQLKGPTHGISVSGVHDVVIRHLRIRPGTTEDGSYVTNALILASGGATNLVVDHCSMQWGNHWLVGTYQKVGNITFQRNMIAEGAKSPYGQTFAITYTDGKGVNISVHHNLFAHTLGPNPGVGAAEVFDFRNNVVYDFAGDNLMAGTTGVARVNFVSNHYVAGPITGGGRHWLSHGADAAGAGTRVFSDGNWGPRCPAGCANDWDNQFGDLDLPGYPSAAESRYRTRTPLAAAPVATVATSDVEGEVLKDVGATKPLRDSLDGRIVRDVMGRTGSYVPEKVGHGPWPALSGPEPPPDRDHDAMPDAWEAAHGLNPDDPADGAAIARNRYTNVENYLNELAGDPVP